MPLETVFALLLVGAAALPELIERARIKAGCSHKELAYAQGISPAQWCRQVAGMTGQHVALDRLFRAPRLFRAALLDELFSEWGESRPLTAREVLALVRPTMARAELPQNERKWSCL